MLNSQILEKLNQLEASGQWEECIRQLLALLNKEKENEEIFHRLGRLYQRLNNTEKAESYYEKSLRINKNRPNTLNNLALIKLNNLDGKRALLLIQKALYLDKDNQKYQALLYRTACEIFLYQCKPELASDCAKILIQHEPQGNGYTNYALTLRQQNRLHAALRSQTLSLSRGTSNKSLNHESLISSIGCAKGNIEETVNHHIELVNLGLYQLQLDPNSEAGLKLLFANIGMQHQRWTEQEFLTNHWHGETTEELAVWHDQGFGDTFQHLRLIEPAAARTTSMHLFVHPSLINTIHQRMQLPENCNLHETHDKAEPPWTRFQRHIGISNLQIAIKNPENIRQSGYIQASKESHTHSGIGLVWSAGKHKSPQPEWSARVRDIPFKPLLQAATLWSRHFKQELYSLQLDERDKIRQEDTNYSIKNLIFKSNDWLTTIKAVEQLKVVVTADTAMAHLCGALGKACIVVLNCPCDWRWGQHGNSCRIYKTVFVARCPTPGDWKTALKEVNNCLEHVFSNHTF